MKKFMCLCLLFATIYKCCSRDLPSYFPKCYINDPHLNECILNATRILKPHVRDGIEEIKLPSFNPLQFPDFSVIQDNEVININATMIDNIVKGFDDYEFTEISFDPNTLKLQGKVNFKQLHLTSYYRTNTKLIYFPVIGNGSIEAHFGAVNGSFEVSGKLVTRKDTVYYHPFYTKVLMKINGFAVDMDGLFNDNKELAHLTNELINLNGQTIIDVATPVLERTAEITLMKFVKTLTKLVPYEKLFPKSQDALS